MYAIIEDSGTQIRVSPGEVLSIDPRDGAEAGKTITLDKVLVVGDGEKEATIGTPYIESASVTAEVLEAFKDRKVNVVKFKRRKGYHRQRGHRQPYLRVKISEINA